MGKSRLSFPAINIQQPFAGMILSGRKTVETRKYTLPGKYVGRNLFIVETPGKSGGFRARIVGIVKFGPSFRYQSREHFRGDWRKHRVAPDSYFDWTDLNPKWGWPIVSVVKTSQVECPGIRGIIFTRAVIAEAGRLGIPESVLQKIQALSL